MNVEEVLGAFSLVNNPVVLSEEEIKDMALKFQSALLESSYQINQQLQQENKILKENAENNDKVVDKVNWENMLLKKENKILKDSWKKLKEYCEEIISTDNELYGTDLLDKMAELEQKSDSYE